jgi:hypothetical protein
MFMGTLLLLMASCKTHFINDFSGPWIITSIQISNNPKDTVPQLLDNMMILKNNGVISLPSPANGQPHLGKWRINKEKYKPYKLEIEVDSNILSGSYDFKLIRNNYDLIERIELYSDRGTIIKLHI